MASPGSYTEVVEQPCFAPTDTPPSIHVIQKLKTRNEGGRKSWVTTLLRSDMFVMIGRGYFADHLHSLYHRMRLGMPYRKNGWHSVLQLVIYLGSGLEHHLYLCQSKQNWWYLECDDRERQVPSKTVGPHTIEGRKGSMSFLWSSGHWIRWLGLYLSGSHLRELLTGWGNLIPRASFHSAYRFTKHLCPQHYMSFLE